MAGGANNVGPRVPAGTLAGIRELESSKSVGATFQETLGKLTADPRSSFLGLGKVLQNTQLSAGERQVACQNVIAEVLGSNNPYQPLAKDKSFMSAVSGLLVEDPRLSVMIEKYHSRKV